MTTISEDVELQRYSDELGLDYCLNVFQLIDSHRRLRELNNAYRSDQQKSWEKLRKAIKAEFEDSHVSLSELGQMTLDDIVDKIRGPYG